MLTRRQFGRSAFKCITSATAGSLAWSQRAPTSTNALPARTPLPPFAGTVKGGALPSPPLQFYPPMPVGIVISFPPPPFPAVLAVADNSSNLSSWGVMANDRLGDCVLACFGHVIEAWTSLSTGTPAVIPDAAIVQAYRDITGYDPATGRGDTGMTVMQGLNYWIATGIGGHRLISYRRLTTGLLNQIKQTIAEFGVCVITMGMNQAIRDAFLRGQPWVNNYGAITEYHCVPILAYDANYAECVTWGRLQRMNWAFFGTYATEVFIPIGPEMFKPNHLTFSGYSQTDIQHLASNLMFSEFIM